MSNGTKGLENDCRCFTCVCLFTEDEKPFYKNNFDKWTSCLPACLCMGRYLCLEPCNIKYWYPAHPTPRLSWKIRSYCYRRVSHNVVTMETNAIGWPLWLITFWYLWVWRNHVNSKCMCMYNCSKIHRYQYVINQGGHPIALVSMVTTLCEKSLLKGEFLQGIQPNQYKEKAWCGAGSKLMCKGSGVLSRKHLGLIFSMPTM